MDYTLAVPEGALQYTSREASKERQDQRCFGLCCRRGSTPSLRGTALPLSGSGPALRLNTSLLYMQLQRATHTRGGGNNDRVPTCNVRQSPKTPNTNSTHHIIISATGIGRERLHTPFTNVRGASTPPLCCPRLPSCQTRSGLESCVSRRAMALGPGSQRTDETIRRQQETASKKNSDYNSFYWWRAGCT